MVNFARDCKDLEELFLAIKKEFISTINEWKKTGIFNEINNEFLKSMVD